MIAEARVRVTLMFRKDGIEQYVHAEVPIENEKQIEQAKKNAYIFAHKRFYENVDVTRYGIVKVWFRIMKGMEGLHT